jgi:hypothetical protein
MTKLQTRGRPKKIIQEMKNASNLSSNTNNLDKKDKELEDVGSNRTNEITVHFPISMKDVLKYNEKNGLTSETINTDVFQKIQQPDEIKSIFTIRNDISDNVTSSSDSYYGTKNKKSANLLKEKDDLILKLHKEIDQLKRELTNNSGTFNSKIYPVDMKLISVVDNKQIIVEQTDVACWWCSCEFKNVPCFLPDRFYNETYHVLGCFCSLNCASAYNLSINDYRVWERQSLINQMYKDMCKEDNIITPAPKREVLKKYGGILTIEEYRHGFKYTDKEFRYLLPPLTPIIPIIEQNYGLKSDSRSHLRIRRTKPLPNSHNNLIETMGIVQKKNK